MGLKRLFKRAVVQEERERFMAAQFLVKGVLPAAAPATSSFSMVAERRTGLRRAVTYGTNMVNVRVSTFAEMADRQWKEQQTQRVYAGGD